MFGDGSRDVALGEIHKFTVMFTKDDEWPAKSGETARPNG
jgi:hypothetical protein